MMRLIVVSAAAAIAGSATAFVPWSNPNGVGSFFSWSNGGSDNGLFGSPVLVNGDSFVFFPSGFRAESNNGVAAAISDRLSVTLNAFQGFQFDSITITEVGDYGILPQGQVDANLAMFVTDLNNGRVAQDNDTFTSNVPGFGNWSITGQTVLTGEAWRDVQLVLNNNLFAMSVNGGLSFIEKKVSRAIIITVPTPGAAMVLGVAGLAAFRRRR